MTSDTVRYRRLDNEFARLLLRGQDRVRFLSGMVTCDVKGLGPQAGTYGALLTVKGKVVSDLLVANRSGDDLLLVVRSVVAKHVMESLDRYIIVDDAVLTDDSGELAHLGVYGPRALAVLLGDPAASLAPYQLCASGGVWLWACRELGPDSLHVIGPAAAVAALEQTLITAGAQALSDADAEVLRVESGRPRMGVDFDEERLPQEAALDEALCFTKGCFLGQEVVVRLRDRGQLNRRLVGLRLRGEAVPTARCKLSHPSRPQAGELTSVVWSARLERIALGYVHRTCWEPGTELAVTDAEGQPLACTAIVTPLPFPPA